MVTRWLEKSGSVDVVGSVGDGERAVAEVRAKAPDVVVLDIEMPRMDGMTALPKILEVDPSIKVIMSSTLTQRNADISLTALGKGAADYIAKPSARSELHSEGGFGHELVEKVVALGNARHQKPRGTARFMSTPKPSAEVRVRPEGGAYGKSPIVLRKPSLLAPSLIAIGSSTGGSRRRRRRPVRRRRDRS
jgi:two-component system chemotaxis response regulator CheB